MEYYTNIARHGNKLLIRGVSNGKEVRDEVYYEPTLFINHKQDYGYKTIYGENVKPINFDNMKEARQFVDQHKGSNLNVYGFPHYSASYALENFSDAVTRFKKDDIRVANIDIEVTSTAGFPEARFSEFPITAICIYDNKADRFLVFGHGKWSKDKSELIADKHGKEILDRVLYAECADEFTLLKKFMDYWTNFTPNIITGWNIEYFDMPYIFKRLEKVGLNPKKLSPWGTARIREIETSRGTEVVTDINGIDQMDYLPMYKKNKTQESYRLDHIAEVELSEKKLDYSEVNGLHNLYFENFQKFIDYNIQDVNLVKRLDEKLGLIDAEIMIAYEACMNFSEVQSPVRTWDCLINKELRSRNCVTPFSIKSVDNAVSIPGGFVKVPQVGKHGWCLSFDLASLYPSLIRQFNISPETFIDDDTMNNAMSSLQNDDIPTFTQQMKDEALASLQSIKQMQFLSPEQKVHSLLDEKIDTKGLKHLGWGLSASGYLWNNSKQGIIPKLMTEMYGNRKKFKKEMIKQQQAGEDSSLMHLRQMVMKLLLNSGYGAMVNKYFRWFDPRMGESITLSGQYIIQLAERTINEWMNKVLKTDNVDYIIAIDTDSNYVNVDPLVKKMWPNKSREEIINLLDKVADEQIQATLDKSFEQKADNLNAFEQHMVMEREAIASTAFWTAKKRYAMCVWDMEKVRMPADKPKIKIMGLEAIKSSTPQPCRVALLDMIKLTLLEDESTVQKFIADFKQDFMSLPYQQISFPRSMNNIDKYYQDAGFKKGTPAHIRGAVSFNRLLEKHNLSNDWEKMQNGEKGKFIWLLEPNNIGSDVMSFTTSIPEEFAVEKYFNRNKMFEKSIVEPMTLIFAPLGWSVEERLNLTDFFG